MIINLSTIFGGGGGSYVLPTATGSRLGGVKIGSGISVAADGTISAEGGSSQQNYIIVDALSAVTEPYEGLTAFVKSGNTSSSMSGYTFSIEGLEGEGEVYYHSGYRTIYRFDGQGGAEIRDEAQGYAYVQLTSEYQYFDNRIYAKIENGTVYSTLAPGGLYHNTGVLENITLTEATISIPIPYNGNIYRYEQGRWNNIECLWIDDSASQTDLAAAYSVLYGLYTAYVSNKEMLARILSVVRVNRYPALSIGNDGTTLIISLLENNTVLCVMRLASDGSVSKSYYNLANPELPTASSSSLGGVKVGNGLSIDSNGVLSAKVSALSQSDYDALVQAGTVDASTLYIII